MTQYLVPGTLCAAASMQPIWEDEVCQLLALTPTTLGHADLQTTASSALDADTRLLAALAYGEASTQDVFEEMAAIANVLVRQMKSRGFTTVQDLVYADKNFAYAASDGSQRFARLKQASQSAMEADAGMHLALEAARNALSSSPADYSAGAFFWDGIDLKTNYETHAKVAKGIRFSSPEHNIYKLKEKKVPGSAWWQDADGHRSKVRGSWDYVYESTAAWGGTVFWRYTPEFVKASGAKEHR